MKIELPPTLTSFTDAVYPEGSNWLDRSLKPRHEVVVRFGTEEVARVPFTPEQEEKVDYNAQYNDEYLAEVAVLVTASMLRKMWIT